ncbi:MAG: hypothetical protein KDI55_00185 [Anaerolineae bacterium]|nr:hypothetical protein [Anaerolineae bacterium]
MAATSRQHDNSWMRRFIDCREDPAVTSLNDAHFRIWLTLLALIIECDDGSSSQGNGEIVISARTSADREFLASKLRVSDHDLIDALREFGRRGLIEVDGKDQWHVASRKTVSAPKSPTQRTREHRARRRREEAGDAKAAAMTEASIHCDEIPKGYVYNSPDATAQRRAKEDRIRREVDERLRKIHQKRVRRGGNDEGSSGSTPPILGGSGGGGWGGGNGTLHKPVNGSSVVCQKRDRSDVPSEKINEINVETDALPALAAVGIYKRREEKGSGQVGEVLDSESQYITRDRDCLHADDVTSIKYAYISKTDQSSSFETECDSSMPIDEYDDCIDTFDRYDNDWSPNEINEYLDHMRDDSQVDGHPNRPEVRPSRLSAKRHLSYTDVDHELGRVDPLDAIDHRRLHHYRYVSWNRGSNRYRVRIWNALTKQYCDLGSYRTELEAVEVRDHGEKAIMGYNRSLVALGERTMEELIEAYRGGKGGGGGRRKAIVFGGCPIGGRGRDRAPAARKHGVASI